MHPILLTTPWFNVYSYGLMLAIGYTVGTLWIIFEARKDGLPGETIFDMLLLQLVVGVAGSRFLFLWEYAPQFLNPTGILSVESGGLTYYGAVISSFISDYLFLRYMRMPFWRTMDCVGLGLPLGIAFARIGCFLNGCCHGSPCAWPWGVTFPRVDQIPRHPTQLYEAGAGLVIFLLLQGLRHHRKNYGEAFAASMGFYGFFRFIVEFWRGDNPVFAFGFTLSQWIGAGMVLSSIVGWRIIGRTQNLRMLPAEETFSKTEEHK